MTVRLALCSLHPASISAVRRNAKPSPVIHVRVEFNTGAAAGLRPSLTADESARRDDPAATSDPPASDGRSSYAACAVHTQRTGSTLPRSPV
mmetsp:Transcript_9384/g.28514  ORF Transcript_9384/g.28514 Transcript_9384/m.28514 type:complete len:92 (-) Transcript_9384:871-1146(-)|eukprot:scaffold36143_cov31-Tisochrysis_lutea.AAC.10